MAKVVYTVSHRGRALQGLSREGRASKKKRGPFFWTGDSAPEVVGDHRRACWGRRLEKEKEGDRTRASLSSRLGPHIVGTPFAASIPENFTVVKWQFRAQDPRSFNRSGPRAGGYGSAGVQPERPLSPSRAWPVPGVAVDSREGATR